MDRTQGPNQTIENKFTDGDPNEGVPATDVTSLWLNGAQEELMNVIESAFNQGNTGDDTLVLNSMFGMIKRQNLAFNSDFFYNSNKPNSGPVFIGGPPSAPGNQTVLPGWRVGGNLDSAGSTIQSLINLTNPNDGWKQQIGVVTANQYIDYFCEDWQGLNGSGYANNNSLSGANGLLQDFKLTYAMEVANLSSSPADIDFECLGPSSLVSSPDYEIEILEENKLLDLSPGEVGIVSLSIKIRCLSQTTTPITGPQFRLTFKGTGEFSWSFKRFQIFEGAFKKEYIPQWTPSNQEVDLLYKERWSADYSQDFFLDGFHIPVHAPTASTYEGQIFLPFPMKSNTLGFAEINISAVNPVLILSNQSTLIGQEVLSPPSPTFSIESISEYGVEVKVSGNHSATGFVATGIRCNLGINYIS